MRLNRLLAITFLCLLSFTTPLKAHAASVGQNYVQAQFLPPQLLLPPPAEGSKAWHNQIDAVVKAQQSLSLTELAAIKSEQNLRIEAMTDTLGPSFNRERLPKTFAMLDHVVNSTGQVVEADKKFWHTRRPYLSDPRVKLYVDPIDASPSYPSGHTAQSRVLAEVLGMLAPEKLSALRTRADSIARHRVEAGVHYPGDLEGGCAVALLIVGALCSNDDFQYDLDVARKEIALK